MSIAPLNRKLFRDLLAMKGQAFAIAMVVAAGWYVLRNLNAPRSKQGKD